MVVYGLVMVCNALCIGYEGVWEITLIAMLSTCIMHCCVYVYFISSMCHVHTRWSKRHVAVSWRSMPSACEGTCHPRSSRAKKRWRSLRQGICCNMGGCDVCAFMDAICMCGGIV